MENEIVPVSNQSALVSRGQLSSEDVTAQVQLIQQVMKKTMVDGLHYGTIQGCGSKPTLLKPGAEKLGLTFRLASSYEIDKENMDNGHREYGIICTLTHINSGQTWGQGVGSCSTMESKYRYRSSVPKCPECGAEAIIKGKKEYGGGWLCFNKKGGCGIKWSDDAPEAEKFQVTDRVENPDLADQYNTVLKMAKKRAQVDAMLTATAASDIFTQDLEDMRQNSNAATTTPPPVNEKKATENVINPNEDPNIQIITNALFANKTEGQGVLAMNKELEKLGIPKKGKVTDLSSEEIGKLVAHLSEDDLPF